jgi:glycosyltransferase involved in cell wall biosynthesis
MLDIAAVIVSCKRANFLHEALLSVVSQTLSPREIIVVEDGVSESCEAVANSFNGVKYISQTPAGCASARNRAVEFLESELIAFLDDDDLWLPNKLEIQSEFLLKGNYDVAFSHGDEFLDEPQNPQDVRIRAQAPLVLPSAMLVKRESFLQVGCFDEQLKEGGELLDWYARAEDAGMKIGMCECVLIKRRIHANNHSSSKLRDHTRFTAAIKQIIDRRRHANPT